MKINASQADSITLLSGINITQDSKPFIEFQKSNLNNSSLRFVKFSNLSYNGNNIRLGNESEFSQTSPKNSGLLKIGRSNLSLGYTSTKGFQAAESLNIDSSIIASANIIGYPRSEQINISNSTIISSTVNSDYYNYGITFLNCDISDSKLILGCCYANMNFANCKVKNCKLAEGDGTPVAGPVSITNSLFLNTSVNLPSAKFDVRNSKFIVDKEIYDLNGSDITYLLKVGNIFIQNSELLNKAENNYSGLYLSGLNGYGVENEDSIVNNTFTNLYDALYVTDFSSISPNNNNYIGINRYHIANYSLKDFSALNNFYDLKQGQTIDDVIFDSNDDLTYGLVNFTPYSTTPVTTAPISRPKNATKEAMNGNVLVKWTPNPESNLKNYKVYWGYIDGFTYQNVMTVTDAQVSLSGVSVNDSIAVTALNTNSTGINDQQAGYESWFSPALLLAPPLPLKFINFSGTGNNRTAHLTWETSNEAYNDHFEVEYSIDGIGFEKIGEIKVNDINSHQFYFVHNTPVSSLNYYRLKRVDKDGKFVYSSIVKVKLNDISNISIYPNPSSDRINIASTNGISSVIFINEIGQQVMKIEGGNRQLLNTNISNLARGLYRLVIVDKNQQSTYVSFLKK